MIDLSRVRVRGPLEPWRRDLGEYGCVDVRFGKGSRGRGAKTRLVPAINSVRELLDWWMVEVRHQFGPDYINPDAPVGAENSYESLAWAFVSYRDRLAWIP